MFGRVQPRFPKEKTSTRKDGWPSISTRGGSELKTTNYRCSRAVCGRFGEKVSSKELAAEVGKNLSFGSSYPMNSPGHCSDFAAYSGQETRYEVGTDFAFIDSRLCHIDRCFINLTAYPIFRVFYLGVANP